MKNKSTATLLAFFLGGFGAHRFYLEQQKLGWYYLAFCWTGVPFVIGIIDGLAFTFTGYSRFNQKYSLRHAFKKKFEDDEEILEFNTDEKLEQELLEKISAMQKEKVAEYLLDAKARGEYLPRAVYARARAILGSQENIYDQRLDIQ
jgi:TM2 domain-containing membrane protein YozV